MEYFKEYYPKKLNHFIESMRVFKTDKSFKTKELPGFCKGDELKAIQEIIHLKNDIFLGKHELGEFGREVIHNHSFFNYLQERYLPIVESLVGEELECSYNFLSLYGQGGKCRPHLDAPFAKWTLDLCIEQSIPWPIYFSEYVDWPIEYKEWQIDFEAKLEKEVSFTPYCLNSGDALIFSGPSFWHKRLEAPKVDGPAYWSLVFFHFIPKGSKDLLNPAHWSDIFDCQALKSKLILGNAQLVS